MIDARSGGAPLSLANLVERSIMTSITAVDEVTEVMERVRRWPSPARIALAHRILESLETPPAAEMIPAPPLERPMRGVPVAKIAGMFRTDGPALTDEECRQIVEEERWKKYGS